MMANATPAAPLAAPISLPEQPTPHVPAHGRVPREDPPRGRTKRQHPERQHPERQHPERQHPERQHPERQHPERQHPGRQHPEPGPEEPAPGRLAALLAADGGWATSSGRAAIGLGLSAAFGVALGIRDGGAAILLHGMWAAAAPAAILVFGVPALYIVLAFIDAPLVALDVGRSAARGAAALGTCLAGLAPITALFIVSSHARVWGALVGICALVFSGLVGVGHFHVSLREQLRDASQSKRSAAMLAITIFGVLATVAAARIWLGELPIYGGGR
jgi:hypothetical protein